MSNKQNQISNLKSLPVRLMAVALCLVLLVLALPLQSQTQVVMPHLGVDTLHVTSSGCYTILDPGGLGRYQNNEDSYLYILADESFYLQVDYNVGRSEDGKDWVRVWYDTVEEYYYSTFLQGTGSCELHLWNGRALVHFHSNAYNSFDGFVMTLQSSPTIGNFSSIPVDATSVKLQWSDSRSDASQWTVHYFCNNDTVLEATSNTNSVVLTGLHPERNYKYYVDNDVIACQHHNYGWFSAHSDSSLLVARPYGHSDTVIPVDRCYRLLGLGADTIGIDNEGSNETYRFNDGHGVYVEGSLRVLSGDLDLYRRYVHNSGAELGEYFRSYNTSGLTAYHGWFPEGRVRVWSQGKVLYDLSVLPENDGYVVPTVSGITATGATVSWTDSMASSSYTFSYCKSGGEWVRLTTSSPSVTLSGLEPGCQYIYTIEGNMKRAACDVAARHAFITSGSADTIIMPYRGNTSVTLQPRGCYVVVDAGGRGNYFDADFSRLVLRSANHKGFRVNGKCSLANEDRLVVQGQEYSGSNRIIEAVSVADSVVICFQSDVKGNASGFVLEVEQVEDSITGLRTVSVGATTATVAWNDASGATSWTVHYGDSEDNFQSVVVTSKQATLVGLTSGKQYVWYVTNNNGSDQCVFSDRRAFITTGLPANEKLMPYRGVDTLIINPNTCYHIWDAGGLQGNYFNNDSSVLVVISSDGSDFTIDGQWLFGESEAEYLRTDCDYSDVLYIVNYDNPGDLGSSYYGNLNRFNTTSHIRYGSSNGWMRIVFRSNGSRVHQGFCLTVDRSNGEVDNVRLTRVTNTSATVNWNDNSGATQWTIAYGPVGGTLATTTSTVRNVTLNSLTPNTDYEVKVYNASGAQCGAPSSFFTTLQANSIVMRFHGDDTVYLTPGECYYVYDPGGTGDYLPSDTSRLVLRSTTGEGFYYYATANVGSWDYSDRLYISNAINGQVWWGWDSWVGDGELTIELNSNEALQERGFAMCIRFASHAFLPDTSSMTDSSVVITWQDTSLATQWNVTYGPHIDSMTTVTTSTKSCLLTGLQRNRQYFYSIYGVDENPQCLLENWYGVIMPTDDGLIIHPYSNYYQNCAGRHSRYYNNTITLVPGHCYRVVDAGGAMGDMFLNENSTLYFNTEGNLGVTVEGRYDQGNSSFELYSNIGGAWYSGTGSLNVYAPNGYFGIYQNTGRDRFAMAPGFDFDVSFNYPIHNVRTQALTCTSATLMWDDTTAATQWTLAYGPTEKQLDTLTLTTKSVNLTGLLPDHQYVCYLTSNNDPINCMKPVKYCFITSCDSTILVSPYCKDTTFMLDMGQCYTVLDGGSEKDHLYNDHHNVMLRSRTGNSITLRGWIDMGKESYLEMWDEGTGQWFGGWSQADNFALVVPSGWLHISYRASGDTLNGPGFRFEVAFNAVSNVQVSLKTDTTCRLTWDDNSGATQWVCHYGTDRSNITDSVITNIRQAHLTNLVYGNRYYVFFTNNSVACIDTTWFEFCAGGDKCIDFGDIYSCFATAKWGRVTNPDENTGLIDYGPDDISSRHTTIDDTTATDPRTGGQLRCVPPGYYQSVRLGNWDIGGEAESMIYEYDVDTTKTDALLLRYAAVLENPGHSPSMQPRFRFAFIDEWGNEIDPDCYSADFVSSDALGWNTYHYDTNTVLWKDWTAVGVDLAPLHGRRVWLKLTTYDCAEMGHYGYAYFVLGCERKTVAPSLCGMVNSNIFTAPEGFSYKWYNIDSANVTLSTERTFTSTQNGIYKCRASFLGSSSGLCYFEKTAIVGDIFPYANYDYEIVDTNGCDVVVQFHNRSCVTTDSAHTQPTSMECSGFMWDFGDGTYSSEPNPSHIFPSREFDVTLTAMMADGSCSDDTTRTILILSPCITYDTLWPEICDGDTFALRDSLMTITGDYTVRSEYRPDSIVTSFVHLTVHPTLDTNLLGGICDGKAYSLFGFNEGVAGDYVHAFTSQHGCDSIYRLHLVVSSSYDTVISPTGCSSTGYSYSDTLFMTSTVYVDSLMSIYMCDSVVTLNVTIWPSYDTTTYDTIVQGDVYPWGDTLLTLPGEYDNTEGVTSHGCDSVARLNLAVVKSHSSFVDSCSAHIDILAGDTLVITPVPFEFRFGTEWPAHQYSWTPGDGFDDDSTRNPRISLPPDTSASYRLTVTYEDTVNIIPNGLFDMGDTIFGSDYTSLPSPSAPDSVGSHSGVYAVMVPSPSHPGIADCLGGATRSLVTYPADTTGLRLYYITIAVDPYTDYRLNYSVAGMAAPDTVALVWTVDGDPVGSAEPFLPESCSWNRQSIDFETQSQTLITLAVADTSYRLGSRAPFAVDSLQLHRLCRAVDSVAVRTECPVYDDTVEVLLCHDSSYVLVDGTSIDEPGLYTATVQTLWGCDSTVTVRAVFNPCCSDFLQFPNLVTPNGDGINDRFVIVGLLEEWCYPFNELAIYNKWGQRVFYRKNIVSDADFWDPNDGNWPDGTYYFHFDAKSPDEAKHVQRRGVIEVLRDH